MAKEMKVAAWSATLLTAVCSLIYAYTRSSVLLILAITFGTTAYHFLMRLAVGTGIHLLLRNRVNYRLRWFRVGSTEQKFYKKLGVRKWKTRMPTYDPSCFDPKKHNWDEIAQATCQAELVHEVIILLSFVPLLAAIPFGELWVFTVTSLLAACFDGMFVIMQRYNRPRLLKLVQRAEAAKA